MEVQVSENWQITIPLEVREEYNLKKNQKMKFIRIGKIYYIVPLPDDVIKSLRGSVKPKKSLKEIIKEERSAWKD